MGAGKAGHKLLKNDAGKGIRESGELAAASGSVTAAGAGVPHTLAQRARHVYWHWFFMQLFKKCISYF